MKSSTIAILAAAATGTIAGPSKIYARNGTTTTSNFILPNAMAVHSINSNANTPSTQIQTIRLGGVETSTLVSFVIPSTATGTCKTHISAGRLGSGDKVQGSQIVDIFSTLLTDINTTPSGNQRNLGLGRLRFNGATNEFDFDARDVQPTIQTFPCPAGKTLQWEIVAVGESDEVIIGQDFTSSGSGVPNGISIEF
ncbi:hypothetical protein PLICBS_002164 [Purpureocillium lilacinum]|uniref:uncharacterized protein n=1 Tax=Purpureocillium lilacinum TaxID=33203 RepID=UPI0020866492|nr:hypothetical protein PLICBS_002164 [Purpureocillium lilacinum]